jgi:predicted NUDIX family phosphoesterase
MSRTDEKIIELLKYNTGKALCDSGDAYGRNYERNQDIDFEKTDRVEYEIYTDNNGNSSIDFSVSLYHYLNEILEINNITDFLNESYNNWYNNLNDDDDDCDYSEFLNYIGAYSNQKYIENSYNYDNNLTQVIQYYIFNYNNRVFVFLQIHGGCDVRGGYTDPYIFELNGYLTGNVDVFGTIDNIDVTNTYNGYSLTDENGNEIEIKENSKVNLDFYVMDDVSIYD